RWNSNFPTKRPPLGASSSTSTGALVGCPLVRGGTRTSQKAASPWGASSSISTGGLSGCPLVRGGTRTSQKSGLPWERRVPSRRAGLSAALLVRGGTRTSQKAASPGSVEFHLDGRACRLPSLFEMELELPTKRPPLGASSSISTGALVGCPPCSRWNSNFPTKRPPLGASSSISTGALVGCPLFEMELELPR